MISRKSNKNIRSLVFLTASLCMALLFCGCSDSGHVGSTKDMSTDEIVYLDEDEGEGVDLTAVDTDTDYMITSIDKKEKVLAFCKVGSLRDYQFRYDNATMFLNKYGDYISVDDLRRGRIVNLGDTDSQAILTLVKLSGDVWYQEDVRELKVFEDDGYVMLGQEKYRITDATRIFYKKNEMKLSDISENDTLAISGKDKELYSVRIVKGHGTVAIYNTGTFDGGWMNLGGDIYTTISGDMNFELPQGTYKLTVANNGWGDTGKIKVEPGKVTKVDLEEYRGKGPERSLITFEINVAEATLMIDGEEVDHSEPVEVVYGIHTLTVKAKGYEKWENRMVVHSKTATITIDPSDLTEDGTPKGSFETEENEGTDETASDEDTDSTAGNTQETSQNEQTEEAETRDASQSVENSDLSDATLSTLRELLRSIVNETD